MKNISILGSTGSIGTQSLDIIRRSPDRYRVVSLSCATNVELLTDQIMEFEPQLVAVATDKAAKKLKNILMERGQKLEILVGDEGLCACASLSSCDIVLNSLVGMRGLLPTYEAIKHHKDVALANKETLVAGGELIMDMASQNGVKLFPIDSEHSAIFQCLQGNSQNKIKRILLTASGGPFRGFSLEQLKNVTLAQALKHPKWNMGAKITIDSATLMNKGLEVIEARWLFDVAPKDIEVLVHPQSIVHSMVEYQDRSVIAQLGNADMRVPISYALSYPERVENDFAELDFFSLSDGLTFEKPDLDTFRCLSLAFDAIDIGGSMPVVLNSANEELVALFLAEKISFLDIQTNIEKILSKHKVRHHLSLDEILEIDQYTRDLVHEVIR